MSERKSSISDLFGMIEDYIRDMSVGAPEDRVENPVDKFTFVRSLSIGDEVVLSDGKWEVHSLTAVPGDPDVISVSLSNGMSYDLLAHGMIQVAE